MITYLIKKFRNSKLRTKLLLSNFFVVLILILFIGYFLINRNMKIILEQNNYINKVNFVQLTNNFNNEIDKYTQTLDIIATDNNLLNFLNNKYAVDNDENVKYLDFNTMYRDYTLKNEFIELSGEKLSIYTDNVGILTDGNFLYYLDSKVFTSHWCTDILAGHGADVISAPYMGPHDELVVPFGKMFAFQGTNFNNFMKLDIPEKNLYNLIQAESKNKSIYVLNSNGYVITSTDRDLIGHQLTKVPGAGTPIQNTPDTSVINNNGKTIYFGTLGKQDTATECRLIEVIPTANIMAPIYQNIDNALLICFLSLILSILLILVFSNQLTKRLKLLAKNMAEIRNGNFNVFVDFNEGDEIGEISGSFKSMIDRINNLITEVYKDEIQIKELDIQKKEAELHALYSQINPHFIFNTMESVRMNLVKKGEREVSDIIRSFSGILRQSINWSEDNITLKQEFDLVEAYLKIQKFRFKERLQYEIVLPEELYNFRMPKFTLQPLVENSILHGLETKAQGGFILITAEYHENDIKITIKDSGSGITESKLQEITASLENGTVVEGTRTDSIGLENVYKRLRLFFGESYGFKINSIRDIGTSVVITMPNSNLIADS